VENAQDNAERNGCEDRITTVLGDAKALSNQICDVFIANINRNIILQDIEAYLTCIPPGGILITSGYYEQDLPQIRAAAESRGMHFNHHLTRDEWCCALFNRN
jgi:ribosomal protein L11 methyltransferase